MIRRFLLVVGAFMMLAGSVLAALPWLVAATARTGGTAPLTLLATRELGLALGATGALALVVGRGGQPDVLRSAVVVLGVLAALAANHLVRLATETELLCAPAHGAGEILGLCAMAALAGWLAWRGGRSGHRQLGSRSDPAE